MMQSGEGWCAAGILQVLDALKDNTLPFRSKEILVLPPGRSCYDIRAQGSRVEKLATVMALRVRG